MVLLIIVCVAFDCCVICCVRVVICGSLIGCGWLFVCCCCFVFLVCCVCCVVRGSKCVVLCLQVDVWSMMIDDVYCVLCVAFVLCWWLVRFACCKVGCSVVVAYCRLVVGCCRFVYVSVVVCRC